MAGPPRDVNFFVLIIFAANSRLVDFWTHRLTMEKAPLRGNTSESFSGQVAWSRGSRRTRDVGTGNGKIKNVATVI